MHDAHTYLKEMEDRKIALHPYVDADVLEAVYKAVGGPARGRNLGSTGGSVDRLSIDGDDEEVMDEDIDEVGEQNKNIVVL